MNEAEYSLKESFRKIGALPIPKFKDQKGNIIDGLHREMIGAKVPTVTLPIKNPLQFHLVRLVINKCRRNMSAEEITQDLTSIAELSGWTPKEMAENLPFSYTWIMKYLPDKYKQRPGAGPKEYPVIRRVTQERIRDSKLLDAARQLELPKEKFKRLKNLLAKIEKEEQEAYEGVTSLNQPIEKRIESEEEFIQRFTNAFSSRISQLIKHDFPTIVNHMNEEQNCDECLVREACSVFLDLIRLKAELPICMQKKL